MSGTIGATPTTPAVAARVKFVPVLDLSKRRTERAAAAPVESFSPQEQEAIAKLPSRAQMLAYFKTKPESAEVLGDAYGVQKKLAFTDLESAFLKTHTKAEEDAMLLGVQAKPSKEADRRPQDTLAMARLMAQSLKTQEAMKLEAEVAAGVVGGERVGGAQYDLNPPKPALAGLNQLH